MIQSLKEQRFHELLEWLGQQADIRAVALVGSAARSDHPADEWSDYDLLLVAADPRVYLASPDWLAALARAWAHLHETSPTGEPLELRVLLEGGLDFDFIVVATEDARRGFQEMPIVLEIIQRGIRVLLDKDGLLSTLPLPLSPRAAAQPPTCQEFLEVVNDFWFHVAWTAKKLRRGETWVAKACCDQYLKSLLLRMVAWEAQAAHGWELDTWFDGRFLEEWALPETLAELRPVFAAYDSEDIWRALAATAQMFRRMATRLAGRLGYPYPTDNDQQISQWVARLHTEGTAGG